MNGREVLRSCIACRSVRPKEELVRFVLSPALEAVADYYSKLPGRGAYLCFDRGCIGKAVKVNAFSKAFRCKVKAPSAEEIIRLLGKKADEKTASMISLAIRSRKALLGATAVEDGLKGETISLLLLTADLSGGSLEKWRETASRFSVPERIVSLSEGVEVVMGSRKVAGITDEGIAGTIVKEIDRAGKLQPSGGESCRAE